MSAKDLDALRADQMRYDNVCQRFWLWALDRCVDLGGYGCGAYYWILRRASAATRWT